MDNMIKKFMESKETTKVALKEGFVPQDNRSFSEVYGDKGISKDEAVNESKVGDFLNSLINEDEVKDEPKMEESAECKEKCEFDIDKMSKDEIKDLIAKLITRL